MRGLLSFDLCFVGTKDEQPLCSLRRRADRVTARWNPAEDDAFTAREIGNLLLAGRRLGDGLRLQRQNRGDCAEQQANTRKGLHRVGMTK